MRNSGQIFLGDWVCDQYGRIGRVYAKHYSCPEGETWLAGQVIPVTDSQRNGAWCSVLVHNSGSVVQPVCTLRLVENPPANLDNRCSEFYFRPVPAALGQEEVVHA